uniref:Ephrin-A1 n=1 Tax=Equus caballus TaxID=9796 RepID=F6WFS0_HORSE
MEFLWAPLLGLCCSLAAADRHTVFWNSSNPKFWSEDYTVHVRLNDYLDIICPHYEDDSVADAAMERYTLYLVEREQYQLCQPLSKDQVRWQCNQPSARHGPEKLSEKFQRFTPFTLGKEFKEGHSYYYISKPIHHQEDRCLRLKVTVDGKITHSPQAHANPQEKRLPAGRYLEQSGPRAQKGICLRRLGTIGGSLPGRGWRNLVGLRASASSGATHLGGLCPLILQMTRRCRFYIALVTVPPPASSHLPGLCCSCHSCCCKPRDGVNHIWPKDWNWAEEAGAGTQHLSWGPSQSHSLGNHSRHMHKLPPSSLKTGQY